MVGKSPWGPGNSPNKILEFFLKSIGMCVLRSVGGAAVQIGIYGCAMLGKMELQVVIRSPS